jgi:hypothetical protein
MFMTRRRETLMPASPPGQLLKICLIPGSAQSVVQAKICSRVSELLTYPGRDSTNAECCLGGQ